MPSALSRLALDAIGIAPILFNMSARTKHTTPCCSKPHQEPEPTEHTCRHGSRPIDERCEECWREEGGEEE